MTASRTPILPLAFEHLILASFRKIKTNLAAASSPAARQTSPRFGDKANPLSFEGLLDFHDGGEIALSYPLPPVQFREASHHDPGDGLGEHLMVSARHAEPRSRPRRRCRGSGFPRSQRLIGCASGSRRSRPQTTGSAICAVLAPDDCAVSHPGRRRFLRSNQCPRAQVRLEAFVLSLHFPQEVRQCPLTSAAYGCALH